MGVIHCLCATMVASTVSAIWQSVSSIVEIFRASIWYDAVFQQLFFNTKLNWIIEIDRLAEQDLFGLQNNQVTEFSINIFLPNDIPWNTVIGIPTELVFLLKYDDCPIL